MKYFLFPALNMKLGRFILVQNVRLHVDKCCHLANMLYTALREPCAVCFAYYSDLTYYNRPRMLLLMYFRPALTHYRLSWMGGNAPICYGNSICVAVTIDDALEDDPYNTLWWNAAVFI